MPISLTDLQIDEVLRYMGTPPDRAEPAIRKLAEGCARELLGVVRPRWAARTFELTPEEGGVRLSSGLLLPGEDLKRHLAGCRRAVLFCATLSAQADALIRRAESGDMLRALALDSCATAAVEQLCDQIELELQRQFPGCFSHSGTARGTGICLSPFRAACWPCWTPRGRWDCVPAPAISSPRASR